MMHSLLDADLDIDRRGLLERNDISDMPLPFIPRRARARVKEGKEVTAFLFPHITVAPLFILSLKGFEKI